MEWRSEGVMVEGASIHGDGVRGRILSQKRRGSQAGYFLEGGALRRRGVDERRTLSSQKRSRARGSSPLQSQWDETSSSLPEMGRRGLAGGGGSAEEIGDFVLDAFEFVQPQTGIADDKDVAARAVFIDQDSPPIVIGLGL